MQYIPARLDKLSNCKFECIPIFCSFLWPHSLIYVHIW